MDELNLCWRGMAGVGKKTALRKHLATLAAGRGLPFNIAYKSITGSGGGEAVDGTEDASEDAGTGQVMIETSLVHMGFDIARMSMQDKQILRPILTNLGQGSQVLAGEKGRGSRILVLYHAHLLSSESILLIQSCLEINEGDVSVWMTSEMPVAHRIRDWFVEIPVAGEDRSFEAYKREAVLSTVVATDPIANWPDIFHGLLKRWVNMPEPTIEDIKEVKAFVYELLMRNLRWVEATHFLLDVFITNTDITEDQRKACIKVLANCEATAGGFTIPSYRIPILWESVFLQVRNIVYKRAITSGNSADGASRPRRAPRGSKKIV